MASFYYFFFQTSVLAFTKCRENINLGSLILTEGWRNLIGSSYIHTHSADKDQELTHRQKNMI